jgi:hypothetical protein
MACPAVVLKCSFLGTIAPEQALPLDAFEHLRELQLSIFHVASTTFLLPLLRAPLEHLKLSAGSSSNVTVDLGPVMDVLNATASTLKSLVLLNLKLAAPETRRPPRQLPQLRTVVLADVTGAVQSIVDHLAMADTESLRIVKLQGHSVSRQAIADKLRPSDAPWRALSFDEIRSQYYDQFLSQLYEGISGLVVVYVAEMGDTNADEDVEEYWVCGVWLSDAQIREAIRWCSHNRPHGGKCCKCRRLLCRVGS